MTAFIPEPFFAFHVFVCCNHRPEGHVRGSCGAKGSERLRDYMKVRAKELGIPRTRINTAGCLDRCELGPCAVIYPQGTWIRLTSVADVDAVLNAYAGDRTLPAELLLDGHAGAD